MFFTSHLLAGGAIGAVTGEPVSAFLLGIVSHHLLDRTPHTDIGTYYWGRWAKLGVDRSNFMIARPLDWAVGLTDLAIGTAIALMIWPQTGYSMPVLFGALGAVLPDLIDNGPFIQRLFRKTKFGKAYHEFHWRFHSTASPKIWYIGLLTQVAIIVLALWLLLVGSSYF